MIKRWLIYPSLIYLLLTLLIGIWIRFQWIQPEMAIFNSKYLIHAHSHLAMLGWLFPVLAALLMHTGTREQTWKDLLNPYFLIPLHFTIIAMTIAFALEGYAMNSIVLSTFFICLMIWFGWYFLKNINPDGSRMFRLYAITAVWIMIFSNIGPLALSGGVFMGESWIRTWVSYYLHLQFSGWITFAIIALLYAKNQVSHRVSRTSRIGFIMLFAGLLPLLEPLLRGHAAWKISEWTGFAGGLLSLGGTVIVIWDLMRHEKSVWIGNNSLLLWTGLAALGLKALFQFISGIPETGTAFVQTHLLAIGFSHLILLGFSTTLIIGLLNFDRFESNDYPGIGIVLYLAGTVIMIVFVFWLGLHQYLKEPLYLPAQELLISSGILILTGTNIWLLRYMSHRNR